MAGKRFTDIESGVAEYIAILEGPTNAWGRNIGPDGDSMATLMKLYDQFGGEDVGAELWRQFQVQQAARKA